MADDFSFERGLDRADILEAVKRAYVTWTLLAINLIVGLITFVIAG